MVVSIEQIMYSAYPPPSCCLEFDVRIRLFVFYIILQATNLETTWAQALKK